MLCNVVRLTDVRRKGICFPRCTIKESKEIRECMKGRVRVRGTLSLKARGVSVTAVEARMMMWSFLGLWCLIR